jgi:tetratricopeptide (TPR) repeat protein
MPSRTRAWIGLAVVAILVAGCSSGPTRGPYAPITEGQRDTIKAQELSQEAAPILQSEPDRAEALLRQALTADLYFGPAHNNLGVVYLDRGDLYAAAGEFEWARKLMPGSPDPRMNLALTLERAGRTDEALSTYASALEVDAAHIQSIQGLTRLQVRSGRTDDTTKGHLAEIALRGTTERWRRWAGARLATQPVAGP